MSPSQNDAGVAHEKTFARYLRMGRDWPQLRGPLAIAILASSALDYPDPLDCFRTRHLFPHQVQRTVEAAQSLHKHYGIEARKITPDMAQLEWQRAVSAATYIAFKIASEHPHNRYDPYHDYVVEADSEGLFNRIRDDHSAFKRAGREIVQLYNSLASNKQLASLFRSSFLAEHNRRDWISANRTRLPSQYAAHDGIEDMEPANLRRAIIRDLHELMLPKLQALNPHARFALAMGIDWKLLE